MGKPDMITKEYMRRPEIFADVFNKFLYHGIQKILPARLTELDTTEIVLPYGTDDAYVPEQRYRDVVKLLMAMTDGKAAYCILAVENEMKVNYAMPVKDGLYDFMHLAKQVTETARSHKKLNNESRKPSGDEYLSGFWKDDRLLPVVTVVVYFGADEWDGPLSLREMYAECDHEILKYAADYGVNLIAPGHMQDAEIDEFQTNFREIMKYIKYSKNMEKLDEVISRDDRFKSVERQAADLINVVTGSNVEYPEKERSVNMCLAIKEMRETSRMEGEIQGAIDFAQYLGISKDEVKNSFMVKYKKNEDEAEEILRMYWK